MSKSTSHFPILDDLDAVMSVHPQTELNHWKNGRDSPTSTRFVQWVERGQCSFLGLAIQARLRLYIERVLAIDQSKSNKRG